MARVDLQEGAAAAGGQDALQALMGLTATPLRGGGFRYTHADSGLVFEIATALNTEHGKDCHCVRLSGGTLDAGGACSVQQPEHT